MTLNFFIPEQGFQKNLIDPSSQIGTKRDYVPSVKKDSFQSNRSENSSRSSNQDDNFSNYMSMLKHKESQNSQSKKPDHVQDSDNKQSTTLEQSITLDAFHTQQNVNLTDLQSSLAADEGMDIQNVTLDQIVTLQAEIQRLINAQANDSTSDENQISVNTDDVNKDVESVFALLASFLDTHNKDDADQTKSVDTDTAFGLILEKLSDIAQSEDALTITSGLTPEQMTELQEHIQSYLNDTLNERDKKALESLAAQFVSITPPKEITATTEVTAKNTSEAVLQKAADTLLEPEHFTQSRYEAKFNSARYDSATDAPSSQDSDSVDFKTALKNADGHQAGTNAPTNAANQNAQTAAARFLQATGLQQGAAMPAADGTLTPTNTAIGAQGTQTPIQTGLTTVVTQSQHAGQAHPATQMVSATIQKALKAGEDTNIKLRLDPPELGRVEVKMSIDKNNVTKIVLTAEKPETFLMLQRDAHILERALGDAGLTADNNLSFELASDNHDFNKPNQSNGQSSGYRGGRNNDVAADNIIETSIDWHVDPSTGRMHYNVLV